MLKAAAVMLFLCLWSGAGASAADGAPAASPPPHVALGNQKDVVRISAATVLRWQEDGRTLLDLQGNANIYQGESRIASARLLVWFSESTRNGAKAGVLDVYGEKGTTLIDEGKQSVLDEAGLIQLIAPGGLVLSGGGVAGERPAPDAFRARALILHGDLMPGIEGPTRGLLEELHPSAERMTMTEQTESGATVTLIGNAAVVTDDMTLVADALRVRIQFLKPGVGTPRLQSIYAEGAVDFLRGDVHITCDALYLDGITQQGLAIRARIRTHEPTRDLPIQFSAEAIREQSLYRFITEGRGYLTTSALAEPHLRVESPEIQIILGPEPLRAREKAASKPALRGRPEVPAERTSVVVAARDITGYIESVPVFYWPYIAKDVRTGTFLIKGVDAGNSSNFGSFAKLQWDLYDLGLYHNAWSDLVLRTDAYSKRGVGYGLDFPYQDDARHGFARAYFIHDYATEDDTGLPVQRSNRGEITLRDREMLGDGWKADLELGFLSDRRFLYTYDRRSLDEDLDRETQLFLSHVSQNTMFVTQARTQINPFQNQLERDSVQYHVIGEPVLDTPLLWTTHTDVSHLHTRFDRGLGLTNPDPLNRFDTANQLSAPFQLSFIRLEPFLSGGLSGFSEGANDEGSSLRGATSFGARAAADFYRTYESQSRLFQVDRLRHIVTPTVDYENRYYVSRDPSHYIQNDEIDALDESHVVTTGVRSRLQTYRQTESGRHLVELLLADIKYHRFIRQPNIASVTGDYVEATAHWSVNQDIELGSPDDRYNTEKNRLEALNGEVTLNYWRPVKVSLIHKYYLDPTDTAGPWHSISLVEIGYQPAFSRWRVDFSATYDFTAEKQAGQTKDPRNLGSALYFTRNMEGWNFSVGAEFNQGLANETIMMFRVTPPGVSPAFRSSRSPI